jgi:hypothetical protein
MAVPSQDFVGSIPFIYSRLLALHLVMGGTP